MNNWGLYVLFLIVAAGVWEIYKECRSGALVRKALASYRLPDISRDVYAEPLMRVACKIKPRAFWGLCIFMLVLMSFAAFYVVLPVLLTGDFSEMNVPKWKSPHLMFIIALLLLVGGTFKTGPFLLIKGMIAIVIRRGPFLFFEHHMEIHPFPYGKKQIYPYEALEVRLEISEHESKGYSIYYYHTTFVGEDGSNWN